jgi:oxygen-independent coproporphyrinogen III oxidase
MAINVYIHVPFCQSKCHYCDFYSLTGKSQLIPAYLRALEQEITHSPHLGKETEVASIYFGGGTPSLLSPIEVEQLIHVLASTCTFASEIEITLEANPESLKNQNIATYKKAGINRLSFGLQAWQDRLLLSIGRRHSLNDFIGVFMKARIAGFTNIGIDLIFGLPDQTETDWVESLTQVIGLAPEHIACYSLELDNQSVWGKLNREGTLLGVDDEVDRSMYMLAVERLRDAGYHQYEISNWALPGKECRHNLDFWLSQPYLGFGAGAYSWYKGVNNKNNEHLIQYLQNPLLQVLEDNCDDRKRWLLLRLRLINGFTARDYETRFKTDLFKDFPRLKDALIQPTLLLIEKDIIRLTPEGRDRLDAVMEWVFERE